MEKKLAQNGKLALFWEETENGPRLYVERDGGRFSGSVDAALNTNIILGNRSDYELTKREYDVVDRWSERFAEYNG